MSLEDKNYIIDPNGGEKMEIKPQEELANLEKKVVPGFSGIKKIASAMFTTAMLSANNIDTSKLPHYAFNLGKYITVKIEKGDVRNGDYSQAYDTGYYERYNKKAKHLESSFYRENIDISKHIVGGYMKFYGHKYKLVNLKKVSPSSKFLKSEELDKVVVTINGKRYITKPKFLQLDFEARGRKGYAVYGMGKSMALVYVPYKDHILVLGSVVDGSYYEEDKHKIYDINFEKTRKKQELFEVMKMLGCKKKCKLEKSWLEDLILFKEGNKLVGMLKKAGNEKLIIKNGKVVGQILYTKNGFLIQDNHFNILKDFSGLKKLHIKLNQTDMDMSLYVK